MEGLPCRTVVSGSLLIVSPYSLHILGPVAPCGRNFHKHASDSELLMYPLRMHEKNSGLDWLDFQELSPENGSQLSEVKHTTGGVKLSEDPGFSGVV